MEYIIQVNWHLNKGSKSIIKKVEKKTFTQR